MDAGGHNLARLNLEDTIDADPRFKRLVKILGNEDQALGMIVRFWRLAQLHWGKDELVPFDHFELDGFGPILTAGLAEKRAGGMYAKGSEERFAWYRQKLEASPHGVEARKKQAEKSRKANSKGGHRVNEGKKPQPEVPSRLTEIPPPVDREEIPVNRDEIPVTPLTLSLSLTNKRSTSYEVGAPPAESTPTIKNTGLELGKNGKAPGWQVQTFIGRYISAFQRRYGTRPIVDRHAQGEARKIVEGVGYPECLDAAEAYLQLEIPKYLAKCHDLISFRMDMNSICTALRKGVAEPNKHVRSEKWERDFLNEESDKNERLEGN